MTRYCFGTQPAYELWVRNRQLLADGRPVALGSRALDLLVLLAENAGQVVSRRTLLDRVWPEAAVEDNNLSVHIGMLRKALGPALITTVAGRGYCLTPDRPARRLPEPGDSAPAVPGPTHLAARLAAHLPRLIGRDDDLARLEALLQTERLVTLLGPGGVGKTLLAQHLLRRQAGRFTHGVGLVDLSGLATGDGLPGAVAAALQVDAGQTGQTSPADPAGRTGLTDSASDFTGLAQAMAPLHMMVVLDNAEHLLAPVAQLVLALHQAAPRLQLLVTSQARLNLAGECVFRLAPLAVPEQDLAADAAQRYGAVQLFVDRARAADASFTLTDEAAPVAIALCRALDGLPLAIELAAGRAPLLGLPQLAASMQQPLALLASSTLGRPPRLQTLRQALAWSHGLLGPREQMVLRRLSVLAGSADLALVQATAGGDPARPDLDPWAVTEALLVLVERSLVATVSGPGGSTRYRLLEATKAYAREQLVRSGEAELAARCHAAGMVRHFMQAYRQRMAGTERLSAWEERLLPDVDNGHAALAWLLQQGEAAQALRLLPGLMRATPREDTERHRQLLAITRRLAAGAEAPVWAAWALIEACHLVIQFAPEQGPELAREAVAAAAATAHLCPDGRWQYRALCQSAVIHFDRGQADTARDHLAAARPLEDPAWPPVFRQQRWLAEVWQADLAGDGPGMLRASRAHTRLARACGPVGGASPLTLINSALAGGEVEEAVREGLAAVARLERSRHLYGLTEARTLLIAALIAAGRLDEARQHSQAAWPLVTRYRRLYEWTDYQALRVALEGRLEAAARILGFADRLYVQDGLSRTFNELAAVQRARQRLSAGLGDAALHQLLDSGGALATDELPVLAFDGPA